MDQSMSRPHRWRMAIDHARAATVDVQALQGELQDLLEQIQELQDEVRQLRDRAKDPLSRFEDAVVDLICLQKEYECWRVPDNLSESRLQDKINDVTSFDFERLRKCSSDLQEFDLDRVVDVLWEAEECSLPKGYGRD